LQEEGYASGQRRVRWLLVIALVLAHGAALYGLAKMLVPDMTAAATGQVIAAFSIAEPAPPPPDRTESDEGRQGAPGRMATSKPVAAPAPRVPIRREPPAPRAAATGIDTLAGAAEAGEGMGAAGSGEGNGSGTGGRGTGAGGPSKPVLLSGSIDNARDFPVPPGGRAARRGTQVIVRVTVDTDGRARQCAVYRPSPDAEANRITCQLVEARLRFRPATDAAGRPVPAPFYWRQQWF
jgi:protein TonB